MSIQADAADRLEKQWKGGTCSHIWEKEYYLGSSTGDYRCSICGATRYDETYENKEPRTNDNQNKQ